MTDLINREYIVRLSSSGRKNKRFRDYCITCNKDKGFIRKLRLGKDCHQCNSIKMADVGRNHGGKADQVVLHNRAIRKLQKITISEATKKKISESNRKTKHAKLALQGRNSYLPEHKKLRKAFSSLLCKYLKRNNGKKSSSCFNNLNYSLDDLVAHLESKFTPGMSWSNYGKSGWSIDHRIPDSHFIYSSVNNEGFKKSWDLDNLQPMWFIENSKKGDRIQ